MSVASASIKTNRPIDADLSNTRPSRTTSKPNSEGSLEGECLEGRKEGNVLFNDALNTFYLRLYGARHMVKDHSVSERGNPLPPHGLLFPITARVHLYAPSHRQDSTYHGLCHWLERKIAQWVHPMKDRSDDPSHHNYYYYNYYYY